MLPFHVAAVLDYRQILDAVIADPRYAANLDWGESRSGHPEGTVRAHICELESNLEKLRHRLSDDEYWKLKLLVHTHDSFKAESRSGASISDPKSHASLARAFLAAHCADADVLAMVQYHDEPFALYRQFEASGNYNQERFQSLIKAIQDWNLFLAFIIIDGCTVGKSSAPLRWLFQEIRRQIQTRFTEADILP